MKPTLDTTTQTPHQDGNAKSYNADSSVAGNSSNEPSGRFVPPQPNSQVVLHKRWTTLTQ